MSPAAATTGSAARAGPVRTSSAATAARTGRRAIAPKVTCEAYVVQWRRPGLLLAAVVAVLLGVGAATRLGLDAGPGPDGGSVPDGRSPPSSTRATGGKVAEHDEGEGWNLYVAEVASGRIARLTDVESEAPIFADWSPDGRAIAFSRPRCEECPGQLWTMSRRGTRARRLGPATGAVTGVSWSPHGRRIAAAITRRGLVVVSPATGVLRPLTRTRTQDDAPAWGPAGEVAFARRSSRGGWDLWTVTAGGGAPRRLVAGPDQEVEPAWSRDGTRLVYQQEARGGQWTLWT